MFAFDLSQQLEKKLRKLAKKDKLLAQVFKRKLKEIISHDISTISTYKNLKNPMQEYKRVHLTDNFILIFRVDIKKDHILFIDIMHKDRVYSNKRIHPE